MNLLLKVEQSQSQSPTELITNLLPAVKRKLARLLDMNDDWKRLAQSFDLPGVEVYLQTRGSSPTLMLLDYLAVSLFLIRMWYRESWKESELEHAWLFFSCPQHWPIQWFQHLILLGLQWNCDMTTQDPLRSITYFPKENIVSGQMIRMYIVSSCVWLVGGSRERCVEAYWEADRDWAPRLCTSYKTRSRNKTLSLGGKQKADIQPCGFRIGVQWKANRSSCVNHCNHCCTWVQPCSYTIRYFTFSSLALTKNFSAVRSLLNILVILSCVVVHCKISNSMRSAMHFSTFCRHWQNWASR